MAIKRRGLGGEDKIHKDFAAIIRQYEAVNALNSVFWTYNAGGEKRNAITGSLLKSKGLKAGFPDYVFFAKMQPTASYCRIIFLEFKDGKNKQSQFQIEFQKKFNCTEPVPNLKNCWHSTIFHNVIYGLPYSVKEGLDILRYYGILKY